LREQAPQEEGGQMKSWQAGLAGFGAFILASFALPIAFALPIGVAVSAGLWTKKS
jgi:hypothetical protein